MDSIEQAERILSRYSIDSEPVDEGRFKVCLDASEYLALAEIVRSDHWSETVTAAEGELHDA